MLPIKFKESNETYVVGQLEVPIYEDNLQTIVCYKLNREEVDTVVRVGKVWLRIPGGVKSTGWPAPHVKVSVYSPFKKIEPLTMNESIAKDIIIHTEDEDEIILYKIRRTHILNVAVDFAEKVKILGLATELPEYADAVKLYKLNPADVYILKRV